MSLTILTASSWDRVGFYLVSTKFLPNICGDIYYQCTRHLVEPCSYHNNYNLSTTARVRPFRRLAHGAVIFKSLRTLDSSCTVGTGAAKTLGWGREKSDSESVCYFTNRGKLFPSFGRKYFHFVEEAGGSSVRKSTDDQSSQSQAWSAGCSGPHLSALGR